MKAHNTCTDKTEHNKKKATIRFSKGGFIVSLLILIVCIGCNTAWLMMVQEKSIQSSFLLDYSDSNSRYDISTRKGNVSIYIDLSDRFF